MTPSEACLVSLRLQSN